MRRRASPAVAPDFWLLAVSLAAGLGTARLTRAPGAAHVVGPIVATVVAGHLGASVARRLRGSVGVVLAGGVVAVGLATVWGQLMSATRYGIPTLGTWRTLVSRFDTAGTVIRTHPTPVPATPEVVLCIATGAGLVAVLGRSIWAWQEARRTRSMVALLPSFGLFCYTSLLSSQVDRVTGVVAYLVCALAFVIAADRATVVAPVSGAGRRRARGVLGLLPAVAGAVVAIALPLAAGPALATLKVDALPFPPPAGGAQLGGLAPGTGPGSLGGTGALNVGSGAPGVRAIDLVDNLQAVLVNRTDEVMFDARTTLPTYWQVAVLTDFNGTAWLPDPTTEAAAQSFALSPQAGAVPGLPALPEPVPTKTFRAEITIGDLESTLLPLPPTTFSVNTDADMVPGFGAVQPVEAPPGQSYIAVARVPVSPTKPTKPASSSKPAIGGVPVSQLDPYLQLPTEPAPVVALAHQIVAGAKSQAAQAADLARWFNSGRYRYTLTPPPAGPDALESFLFTTREGFCQQFAAAYGVLARIDGLPTRVAVGFTTGDAEGHGRYQVTGADAHVWPEVYLGPSTGWTSYEPTPASSGEATGVGVNSGSRSTSQSSGSRSTATTASTVANIRRPSSSTATVPSTLALPGRGKAPTSVTSGGSSVNGLVVVGIGAALAALVLVGLGVRRSVRVGWDPVGLFRERRRRRRRRPAPDPRAEVLVQWRDAMDVLERARLGRGPAETLEEHAARLRSLVGAQWLAAQDSVDAYTRLADMAARASYAADPCSPQDAADAGRFGATIRSGLARQGGRRGPLVSS